MRTANAVSPQEMCRRSGLDTLRVVATLLVVMLHAGVPYTVAPMPGLTWPVGHAATSPVVDLVFWSIEGAIMPLFFLLSGYGAAQSLSTKPDTFLSSRWRRLGWPLVAAAVVILPVEIYVWSLGWAANGELSLKRMISLKLGPLHRDLWGLSHLWYLEYLLLYSALLWTGRRVLETTLLRSVAKMPSLFLATAAVLWIAPEVIVGFQHSFVPVPAKFTFSGLFFAAGVAEFHRPMRRALPTNSTCLAAGIVLLSVLPLIHRQAAAPLAGVERLVLVLCLTTYTVLILRAAWNWAMSVTQPTSPLVDYLSRASFWTYLVHHPLAAIWHIGLRPTGWPAMVQFTLCTVGTLAISLASYEVLVRRTWLGAFLDGRRTIPATSPAEQVDVPLRRAA